MSPSQFVQIRDAISQECHRFLRVIEDFPELGNSRLRPGTHHHELNVAADGRQIIDQLVGDFSGALKLIHKLLPQCFTSMISIAVFVHVQLAPL
jgi:hypothetical protein